MKNLHFLVAILALSFLYPLPAYASFSLRVSNPRVSWSSQQGTIEEATLSIRPKGLYYEYGLYLTFSGRGTTYQPQDSLEVVLRFDLPENAIVHDSWLWVNDEIVRALILDRWTASSIYEDIVDRRQDPSILAKNSPTQYELRVFPMRADERRKVKITFLMPTDWSRKSVEADLPIQLLKTSRYIPSLQLLTWPDADWQNPRLVDHPELAFTALTDTTFGNYYQINIPAGYVQGGLRFAFDSPLQHGHYLRILKDGQNGLYQLAVLPARFFEHKSVRKVVILIDQEAGIGNVTAANLLSALKSQLLSDFTSLDSFNIILSGLIPKSISTSWIPADPLSVTQAFDAAENQLTNYSNLAPLMIEGIDFIRQNGNKGQLLVASNASQYGNYLSANVLIQDLLALLNTPPIQVHTLNYNSTNSPYFYIGGTKYYGNDYLFTNLAKLTGGASHTVRGSNISTVTRNATAGLGPALRSYDFHTTLENGYCYGRFEPGNEAEAISLYKPILQVGKFQGDLPFRVELAGELAGQFVSASWVVPEASVVTADTLTREMWYGNYIQLLEQEPSNSSAITETIFLSLSERILSRYTAFLCLEDPDLVCSDCQDESVLVSTETVNRPDSLLHAWPNPFTERVTITIQARPGKALAASASLELYAINGQLVHRFALADDGTGKATVTWDGRNHSGQAVAPGVYLAVARTGTRAQSTLRLVRQ